MERADGGSLNSLRKRRKNLYAADEMQHIAVQIARSVEFIHRARVLHADIKPDNFLVFDEDGPEMIIKLSDFGLARCPWWSKR